MVLVDVFGHLDHIWQHGVLQGVLDISKLAQGDACQLWLSDAIMQTLNANPNAEPFETIELSHNTIILHVIISCPKF